MENKEAESKNLINVDNINNCNNVANKSCSDMIFSKKLLKKLNRIEKTLSSKKEDIQLTQQPSKILCVQNGGLGNDVCQEELTSVFSVHGSLDCVIMLPRKPYAFVCYSDLPSAQLAYRQLNGHTLKGGEAASQSVVIYLFYVERAPPSAVPSSELPPGLHVLRDFVSKAKEVELLHIFSMEESEEDKGSGSMKHRQVKHFGYEFKYGINDVDVNDPLPVGIPKACHSFLEEALTSGLVTHFPDQLTVNQYKPGQGIPPHVDTTFAFEDGIMSLSLGSPTVMDFRHPDGRHLSVELPPRSLLVMTGDARYVWSHGITPRKSDVVTSSSAHGEGLTLVQRGTRLSLTFRKVVTDRRSVVEAVLPQTEVEALSLEKLHVQQVYDDIADHFSGTRYKAWPHVVEFLMAAPPLALMADVGCGNGKYLGVNPALFQIGSDFSTNLASICRCRGHETCVGDVTRLPFRSSSFDVVLCIAVIHHMSTRDRRIHAIREIVRVMRTGGRALIYVWAMEQKLGGENSKYIHGNRQRELCGAGGPHPSTEAAGHADDGCNSSTLTNENISSSTNEDTGQIQSCENEKLAGKKLHVHVNRTQFKEQDMLVPWQLKPTKDKQTDTSTPEVKDPATFHRYYHMFREGELESLCGCVDGCVVIKSYHDQGNWCVVLEKTQ